MLTSRPGNEGRRYPADPPRVEEVIAVMKQAGEGAFGSRLRGLIVVLWRAGLRISEALALTEGDLEIARGSVVVRCGKGGRRREVGMEDWAWEQLRPWLDIRVSLPSKAIASRYSRSPGAGQVTSSSSCTSSWRSRPSACASSSGTSS